MELLSQFISEDGLSEFVLDGLKKNLVIDMGAIQHILEETRELRRLSVRNVAAINAKSLGELITMICDLIKSEPPNLEELDFSGLGGSAEQGNQIMESLYDLEMQVKKIDIGNNQNWRRS